MSNASGRLFWILLNGKAAGPFPIAQLHEMLASGEIQWHFPACEVGDKRWIPLVDQPNFGPPRKPRDVTIQATPPPLMKQATLDLPTRSQVDDISMPLTVSAQPVAHTYRVVRRLFRRLIIADILIGTIGLALNVLAMVHQPMDEIGNNNRPSPADGLLCVGIAIIVPSIIAAWVGLWRMQNWGRYLYLGVVCFTHFVDLGTSLFSHSAEWQFPTAVGSVGTTVGGVLLGIAFFSPLSLTFRLSATSGQALPGGPG